METAIRRAITKLANKAGEEVDSGNAMRESQAALNLAHVLATLDNMKVKTTGGGTGNATD